MLIVPMASRLGVNLRTYLERIIGNAGHTLWPRLQQNLRASWAESRALWLVRTGGREASQSATRNPTPQASVSGSTEPYKTNEPAATIEVAAGYLGNCACYQNCPAVPVTKSGKDASFSNCGGWHLFHSLTRLRLEVGIDVI